MPADMSDPVVALIETLSTLARDHLALVDALLALAGTITALVLSDEVEAAQVLAMEAAHLIRGNPHGDSKSLNALVVGLRFLQHGE